MGQIGRKWLEGESMCESGRVCVYECMHLHACAHACRCVLLDGQALFMVYKPCIHMVQQPHS